MSDQVLTPNQNQQQFLDWLKQQQSANVTASPQRYAQFKAEFLQRMDGLSLTIPNQRPDATTLFYSGKVDNRAAWQVAEPLAEASNGNIITIGQTELGRLANDKNFFQAALDDVIDPDKHSAQSADITKSLWDRASHRLASEAKGAVHTITPNAIDDGEKTYARIELPELMRNPNVTQIDGIDRSALADMRHQLQTQHGYTPEQAMDVVRSRISVQSAIDLEQTHGIKSVMHPELRQAQETLRAAAVDLQGSVHGRALIQTAQNLDALQPQPPRTSSAADPPRQPPGGMDPDKLVRIQTAARAAGIAGTAYGVYQGVNDTRDAIDTARSTREQWVRGSEAGADVATRGAVTGIAGAGGGALGAAGGALTSPVTGPVGPVTGAVVVGGAAAVGADNLYEDSRLQQFSRYLGREVGELGYDYVSKEGRLLREVNGLKADLQTATDPAERARLQTRLDTASEQFATEAERNGRYFEGRASIDKAWEQHQTRFPEVDKDDVNDALTQHIAAGKRPDEAARAAISDAVHEEYPRALPHQPVENYRALSNEQLAEKHRQYVSEVGQDIAGVRALPTPTDDLGFFERRRLAAQREDSLNELWRDTGHLGAIREVYKERGLKPPELPAELRVQGGAQRTGSSTSPAQPAAPAVAAPAASPRDAFRQQENADRRFESAGSAAGASFGSRGASPALSPEQQRHLQLAHDQLGPGLAARGKTPEQIERICAAAVCHAQQHAHRGPVMAFHLGKDGERVAVVQERAPMSEMGISAAQQQTSEQHLARAQSVAQAQQQTPTHAQEPSASREASRGAATAPTEPPPAYAAPERAR
jgi:hypothetical protein